MDNLVIQVLIVAIFGLAIAFAIVAITLTRAIGKPIIIEKTNLSTDGKTVEANCKRQPPS